jgi:hypothetical protein
LEKILTLKLNWEDTAIPGSSQQCCHAKSKEKRKKSQGSAPISESQDYLDKSHKICGNLITWMSPSLFLGLPKGTTLLMRITITIVF